MVQGQCLCDLVDVVLPPKPVGLSRVCTAGVGVECGVVSVVAGWCNGGMCGLVEGCAECTAAVCAQ